MPLIQVRCQTLTDTTAESPTKAGILKPGQTSSPANLTNRSPSGAQPHLSTIVGHNSLLSPAAIAAAHGKFNLSLLKKMHLSRHDK